MAGGQEMDTSALVEQFHREGYLFLPGFLAADHVARLLAAVEEAFAGPDDGYGPNIRVRMFERGPIFEELVDYAPTADLMEAILGEDCHLIAQNALLTGPSQSVAAAFHTDEVVRLPLPRDFPLDPRVVMPCFVVNMNYFLTDVGPDLGPTEIVPTSHRSGRGPEPEDMGPDGLPRYNGHGVVSVLARAGDALLWHDQLWHRGAPITAQSGRRVVQQGAYGKRFIAQRFYPFVNYQFPPGVLERATPRRRRLLGVHPRGPYG